MLKFLARNWFPLALIGLFLLAVPGIVLCVLTLTGGDAAVNLWLQENFNLTYHLALPPWVAILFLLLPLAVLLLYFLKLKRRPLQVPSTFLWKKSIEDLHVNSLFQWLRRNILLLLQLLVLLVMIYAILGVRFHGSTTRGKHYILVLDNSASMSATDVGSSRLDWAKEEAMKIVDAASDEDPGMVIVFNSKATTLQAFTTNRGKLREAIRRIEPTQRTTRIDEALVLADSLANPVRSTEDASVQPEEVPSDQERTLVPPKGIDATVHLFTDGRFPGLSEAGLAALSSRQTGTSLLGNLDVRYHRAGKVGPEHARNLGIVAMGAVRYDPAAAKGNVEAERLQVLVRVVNQRTEPVEAKDKVALKLDLLVDGVLVHADRKSVVLPARKITPAPDDDEAAQAKDEPGEMSYVFVLPPVDRRRNVVVQVRLDGPPDGFPVDDEAWLAVGAIRKSKVLVVSADNPILEAFFDQEAARRIVSLQKLKPADLEKEEYRKIARSADVDLVIFDRCAPAEEKDLPLANTLFIDRPPPPWKRSDKVLKNPYLAVSGKGHPILRHITTLWDVGVSEAFAFDRDKDLDEKVRAEFFPPEGQARKRTVPPLTRLLEASGGVPILFLMPRGPYQDLVMAFSLVDEKGSLTTNWPLQPSFPLFFRNVLYVLGNVDDAVRSASVQPGEPMVLRPETGVRKLTVTAPDGTVAVLEREGRPDFLYPDTDRPGIYKVDRDDGLTRSFAVNLLDADESTLDPRPELRLGSEKVAQETERSTPRDLWKWILVLALFLLMAEWYIYNKRVSL